MAEKGKRRRRQFTAEFKRDAVELVRTTGRPIAHIAAELGIYDSSLGAWVKQAAIDRGEQDGLTSDERAQLRELQAENAWERARGHEVSQEELEDTASSLRQLLQHVKRSRMTAPDRARLAQ